MSVDKWLEVVAEFDRIEADIKRAIGRLEAHYIAEMANIRFDLERLKTRRDRLAAKMAKMVEEDNK